MNPFWKDIFREIRQSSGRFFSLLIIAALGAASVVGIQASAMDMREVADRTYKEHCLYDLQLKSATGFDQDDLAALRNTAGVADVMPTMVYDVFVKIKNEALAVRTYALPDTLNTLDVLEGRLPENATECAVESKILLDGAYEIGDTITLSLDDMDDYGKVFYQETYTIVGVVSSPLYVNMKRGNTTLGDGSLSYYLYLHPDAYALDVYTDVYVRMDGSQEMDNLSDAYEAAADDWKCWIEQTGDERVRWQKDERADAQRKIDDGWITYQDGLKELDEKAAEGWQALDDAKIKLDNSKAELENGQKAIDEAMAEAQAEINGKAVTLQNSQAEINARRMALQNGQIELDEARQALEDSMARLRAMGPPGVSPELDAQYNQINAATQALEGKQAELDAGRIVLDGAQKELDDGKAQWQKAQTALEAERAQKQAEIDEGWAAYSQGIESYAEGVETLQQEEADVRATLADAKRDLEEAQEKLDGAPEPEWFYLTRKDGVAFESYYQDTLRLAKIGYVFPMVFFLVAILVSLTSMSRMVEEHRTQIGIYKALGYRPAAIMQKYFLYALSSGAIGGILGIIVGSYLFPKVISGAYGHLYHMPPVNTPIPLMIGLFSVLASVASVALVTLATCAGAMLGSPALLMRPKSPASGKRVLLERVSFIWNRLGFIGKVTARNIFRYKKRFLMTLVGIAGCTALLLTAFGLRDSIGSVATLQYESIVKYDARAYLKEITTESQRAALGGYLPDTHLYIREEAVEAKADNGGLSASLIVPEHHGDINQFINLYAPGTGERLPLSPGSVLVTEKLARTMGVTAGDSFTITTGGGRTYTTQVTGIVENYVLHYIYMSPEVYKALFNQEPYPNSVLALTGHETVFADQMLKNSDVRAVINTPDLMSRLRGSTDALGIVTIVLLVLACALAFVVLFNLTTINIAERLRELATIKVLGFYDNELAFYIYRESAAVTIMGILLGLLGGIYLNRFVLTSVEIDLLKFPLVIHPMSYVLAVAFSAAFALFVNWVMRYKLISIHMVESLKNVE